MRVIDADLPRGRMESLYEHHLEMCNFSADGAVYDCLEILDEAPTIDAAPVVRCKDCKYCHAGYCEKSDDLIPHGNAEREWENWFCADGERRVE